MKLADKIVAWMLTIFPLAHIAFTPREFTPAALWSVSGGLLMILGGVLNLLRIRYAAVAPGVRLVSIVTNAVIALFGIAVGLAANALLGPPGVVVLLYLAALFFSFRSAPVDAAAHPSVSSAQ